MSPKGPEGAPSGASESRELSAEQKQEIIERQMKLGKAALVLTEVNKTDRDNAVNEAAEKKLNKNILAKIPVVGMVVKPFLAAWYRKEAMNAVRESGDVSDAYKALSVEISSKAINTKSDEWTRMRAQLALDEAGFSEGKAIDRVDGDGDSLALNQGESIEKGSEQAEKEVRTALTELFGDMKAAGSNEKKQKEARAKFDKTLAEMQKAGAFDKDGAKSSIFDNGAVRFLIGDHSKKNVTSLDGLREAADNVTALAGEEISQDDLKEYLENNLSLYNASMERGVYTKQKVNSVMMAAAAGGAVGALTYTLLGREARSGVRAALGSVASGAALGGLMGAATGAVRGYQQAGVALSKAEIEAATSAEAIVRPGEELGQALKDLESRPDDEIAKPIKEGEEIEVVEGEAVPEGPANYGSILGALNGAKKALTGEGKYIENINKIRDRKSAKQLYDRLDGRMMMLEMMESGLDGMPDKFNELRDNNPDALRKALISLGKSKNALGPRDSEEMSKEDFAKLKENPAYEQMADAIRDFIKGENASEELKDKMAMKILGRMMVPENQEFAKAMMLTTLEDIAARNKVSQEKEIDLISYSEGNAERERTLLAEKMIEAKKMVGEHNVEDSKGRIAKRVEELIADNKQADAELAKFRARQALVDGVIGAATGAAAGAIAGVVMDKWRGGANAEAEAGAVEGGDGNEIADAGARGVNGEASVAGAVEIIDENGDGTPDFTDADGDGLLETTITVKGESLKIELNQDGSLSEETEKALAEMRENGVNINIEPNMVPVEGLPTAPVDVKEVFTAENPAGIEGMTAINGRNWVVGASGQSQAIVGGARLGDNGDIIMQVAPSQGSNVDVDDMKMIFTPGGNIQNVGIAVDVNANGEVVIPAGSPLASMFEGGRYQGGFGELVKEGANGQMDVYATIGNGQGSVGEITLPNPDAMSVGSLAITVDGQLQEMQLPNELTSSAGFFAANGFEAAKGLDAASEYEPTGDSIEVRDTAGEVVRIDKFEHKGGYSETNDGFFNSLKRLDGANNSGASVVRAMIGEEGSGLSNRQLDELFLEKVESGEIDKGDVVENYLQEVCNSPESLVRTRALLGGLEWDVNGDGVKELVDTEWEMNELADILSVGDPDAYDAFANDTIDLYMQKAEGGTIDILDLTRPENHSQHSTWANLINGNVRAVLGRFNGGDGVGVKVTTSDGEMLYDEDVIRSAYQIGEGEQIVGQFHRLNCAQDNIQTSVVERVAEKTTAETTKAENEKTENEKTENEKTESEKTESEKTESEKTENEVTKTEPEKTESEKTESEKTESEKTESEKTESEKTEPEKTESEKTESEKTESEKTELEKTEPEKTEPEKTEPEKTEPEKTEPEKTESEKTEPEKTEPEKTEPEKTEPEITPKNPDNLKRIDEDAHKQIAENTNTGEIIITPTEEVDVNDITEQPAPQDTQPQIQPSQPSQVAEQVQPQVSPENDYSQNVERANPLPETAVQPNPTGQSQADTNAIPVDQAPTGGQELQDILSDLGIN